MVNERRPISEGQVRKYFDDFGVIESIEIPKDPVTQRPRGFILVEFERSYEAKDAIRALDGFELDGVKLDVQLFTESLRKDLNASESRRGGEFIDTDGNG